MVFSRCWNPEEVGSNASEGVAHIKVLSLPISRYGLKASVFPLMIQIKGLCLPASRSGSKVCVFLPQRSGLETDSLNFNPSEKISDKL